MADTLEQLFEFRWRDVGIPISKTSMSIAHDLVEHKYWRVDGVSGRSAHRQHVDHHQKDMTMTNELGTPPIQPPPATSDATEHALIVLDEEPFDADPDEEVSS